MQRPHCAHSDSIRYGASRGVQRYRCQACRRIFQTLRRGKDLFLKNKPVNSILKGWGCEPSAGFSASIIRRSLAGWYRLPKHSQQAHHRPKSAPSSKSMNSARSSLKKSQCWLWLAMDSILARSSALPVEEGRSKRVRSFGSRSSTCRRWAMARTC